MSIDPAYIRELSDLMYINALLAAGALKGYFASIVVRETMPIFKKEATQRMRYTFLGFSQLVCGIMLGFAFSNGNLNAIFANMNMWTVDTGPFGYLVWFLMAVTLVSPLITLLCFISIYSKPSKMAFRVHGNFYITTESIRAKAPIMVHRSVYRTPHGLQKVFTMVNDRRFSNV